MINYEIVKTDVLVAGSGVAGLCAAYEASQKNLDVTLITKNLECASNYVLGFNCAVSDADSVDCFVSDTLNGGGNINNEKLVQALCKNSNDAVNQIEKLDLNFDKNEDNTYNLLKPLGCTNARLVHIENKTGKICGEKLKSLLEERKVNIINNLMLAEILVKDNKAYGVVALKTDEEKAVVFIAKAVVVATGGIHIAKDSTYPKFMTADGFMASYRAGARLVDLEFVQFEPCRCIYPKKLGISTTLLTLGGTLTNAQGKRFLLDNYKNEGEVTKDMLAKLIYKEVIEGRGTEHGGVYFDATNVEKNELIEKHSLYYQRFINNGIDLTKQKVEVAPCAHSFMGGVVINEKCETDVEGLFAAGEVTGGIHGANRVGGNAGSEIFVFGKIAGNTASEYAKKSAFEVDFDEDVLNKFNYNASNEKYDFEGTKNEINEIMANYMGPIRNQKDLEGAIEKFENINDAIINAIPSSYKDILTKEECKNLARICLMSCKSALLRKESRGVHFRCDYPETDKAYQKNFYYGGAK